MAQNKPKLTEMIGFHEVEENKKRLGSVAPSLPISQAARIAFRLGLQIIEKRGIVLTQNSDEVLPAWVEETRGGGAGRKRRRLLRAAGSVDGANRGLAKE